jgi:enterochelin esterase-like enzyme
MYKIKPFFLFFFLLLFFLIVDCEKDSLIVASSREGHLDELTFRSAAIADNTSGEANEKTIYVLLPPDYDSSNERYPVVYYLHGHGSNATEMLSFEQTLFKAMEADKAARFILVAVDGDNKLGGSFYVNSQYNGRYEDYITQELVPSIDKRYRTLAAAQSRGIMGFSMGGFGALNLGLSHPDLFGAVWALCPGIFVPGKGLVEAMPGWKGLGGTFLEGYAAAFSPERKIPVLDGSQEDKAVAAEWEAGFGGWQARISRYKESGTIIKNIRIVYGEMDMFPWITQGSQYLAALLKQEGLPTELQGYIMGHNIRPGTVRDDALPFFKNNLARQEK